MKGHGGNKLLIFSGISSEIPFNDVLFNAKPFAMFETFWGFSIPMRWWLLPF